MRDDDKAGTSRDSAGGSVRGRGRGVTLGLIVGFAVLVIAFGAHLWVVWYSDPLDGLRNNWGVTLPGDARVLEYDEEESFHGDGYRYASFVVGDGTDLSGTVLDESRYHVGPLSDEQTRVVEGTIATLHPRDGIATIDVAALAREPHRAIMGRPGTVTDSGMLIILHDTASGRYHVFESLM